MKSIFVILFFISGVCHSKEYIFSSSVDERYFGIKKDENCRINTFRKDILERDCVSKKLFSLFWLRGFYYSYF